MELVVMQDLKSCAVCQRVGSSPISGTLLWECGYVGEYRLSVKQMLDR